MCHNSEVDGLAITGEFEKRKLGEYLSRDVVTILVLYSLHV